MLGPKGCFPHCMCRKCRRARNAKAAQHCRDMYYRRRARGLCVRCGEPASPGRVMCEGCGYARKVKAA